MTTDSSDPKQTSPTKPFRWTVSDQNVTFENCSPTNVQYVEGGDVFTAGEKKESPTPPATSTKDTSPCCVSCKRNCHSSLMLQTPRGLLCPACRPATFALTKTNAEFGLRIGGPGFSFQFTKPETGFSLTVEVDHALYRAAK